MPPTVAVALHATLAHPRDVLAAIQACIRCGGDTDTTAAIAGGIVGAAVRADGVPAELLHRIWAAPRTVDWMQSLVEAATRSMTTGMPGRVPRLGWALVPPRNLAFLGVILIHGFRRLLPPY